MAVDRVIIHHRPLLDDLTAGIDPGAFAGFGDEHGR
jgi:hypothetical protein